MVELGPKNEWIGLPFRNWEKQAIRSCGFLRFIGPLASVLLVAFLGAATNPWQTQQRKGRVCFGSVWGYLLLWWCRLVPGAWGNCSCIRKQRGECGHLTHFLFRYSIPPQPMEWGFQHLGWVIPPKCRKSFLNKSKGRVSSVTLGPVTLTINKNCYICLHCRGKKGIRIIDFWVDCPKSRLLLV